MRDKSNISKFSRYKNFRGKGKTIPVQVWRDPEGSRRLRLPNFKPIDT
jgi:hypothetical protein